MLGSGRTDELGENSEGLKEIYGIPENRILERKRALSSRIALEVSLVANELVRASMSLLRAQALGLGTVWVLIR